MRTADDAGPTKMLFETVPYLSRLYLMYPSKVQCLSNLASCSDWVRCEQCRIIWFERYVLICLLPTLGLILIELYYTIEIRVVNLFSVCPDSTDGHANQLLYLNIQRCFSMSLSSSYFLCFLLITFSLDLSRLPRKGLLVGCIVFVPCANKLRRTPIIAKMPTSSVTRGSRVKG